MATAYKDNAPLDFGALMGPVAKRLLGEPNPRLSRASDLRWGNHGSFEVDLNKGVWVDREQGDKGGGVLDLIIRERGGTKTDALAWLEAEGLKQPRLVPETGSAARHGAPIFYDYRDEAGAVAFRVERRGKGMSPPFLQHGPDGKGGFRSAEGCMEGVRRVPYRLPELLAANPSEIVFVCEGEKDADRLAREGLVATTNPGGSGKFTPELGSYLAGRRVVALQDNDVPGEAHVAAVIRSVEGVAAESCALLLPDLPPKGDVSDWLDSKSSINRRSAFDLVRLAEAALSRPVELFEIANLLEWGRVAPTPKAFVMAPYIPRDDVVIVTGDGGTNKSTLALQISACAAAGKQMLGMDVAEGPALYVTAEDDQRENHWRLFKIANAIGTTFEHLHQRLHVVSRRGILNNELATFDSDGKLRTAPAYKLLRDTIRATGAKLVTLDNVAHLYGGNENDRSQVTAFVNLLYQLCNDFGVTILLIAHRNKAGDSYSGSTAWLNAVRSQVLLERADENDADVRRMSLGKANYARAGEQVDFRWHDFALVRDTDLSEDRQKEITQTAAANAGNSAFLACLAERNAQHRQVSEKPTAANYAPRQFIGMPQAKGLSKEKLERAMDRLFRVGAIERGFLYRDSGEGKDIHGLREVGKQVPESPSKIPETSPETSRKHIPETSGDPQKTTGNTQSYINISGAAPDAAAPVTQSETSPRPIDFSAFDRPWSERTADEPDDLEL